MKKANEVNNSNLVNFVSFEGFVLFTASGISYTENRKLTLKLAYNDKQNSGSERRLGKFRPETGSTI